MRTRTHWKCAGATPPPWSGGNYTERDSCAPIQMLHARAISKAASLRHPEHGTGVDQAVDVAVHDSCDGACRAAELTEDDWYPWYKEFQTEVGPLVSLAPTVPRPPQGDTELRSPGWQTGTSELVNTGRAVRSYPARATVILSTCPGATPPASRTRAESRPCPSRRPD